MRKYKISFKTATARMLVGLEPWSNIVDDDAIQYYITAKSKTEVISLVLQYLFDHSDGKGQIDEKAQTITYYDENGDAIAQDYAFEAEEIE